MVVGYILCCMLYNIFGSSESKKLWSIDLFTLAQMFSILYNMVIISVNVDYQAT